jgi:hypothetical protein
MKNKILIFITGCIIFSCKSQKEQGSFIFTLRQISVDTIRINEIKASPFSILNAGKEPMIILNFESSCGCTIIDLEKGKKINPGEQIISKLTITPDSSDIDKTKIVTLSFMTDKPPYFNSYEVRYFVKK